jgi:hypothetical protein
METQIIINETTTDNNINVIAAGSPVVSVNHRIGVVMLSPTDVGLGNVDNTSDLDKPISIATLSAIGFLQDEINILSPDNSYAVHTVVQSTSANWNDGYSYIVANSGIEANQQEVSTFVNNNSANIIEVDTLVNTTSANWNDAYTNLISNSANWNDAYTNLISNSTTYLSPSSFSNGEYNVFLGTDGYFNLENGLDGFGAVIQSIEPIRLISNGNEFKFSNSGLNFPDTSTQTTAYTGIPDNLNSTYSSVYSLSANWNTAYESLSTQTYILNDTSIRPIIGNNTSSGYYSLVSNGRSNTVSGDYSTIINGSLCQAPLPNSTSTYVGYRGEDGNFYTDNTCSTSIPPITTRYGSIGLGVSINCVQCISRYDSSGTSNYISGKNSFIGNGLGNCGTFSGYTNIETSDGGKYNFNPIGGSSWGCINQITGNSSSIINGTGNTVSGNQSSIVGGNNNTVFGDYSSILGGQNNTLTHNNSFILGSYIESSADDTTYVNNLSSEGNISLQGYIAIPDIEGKFWKIGVDTSGNPIGLGAL